MAVILPTSCSLCGSELTDANTVDICENCWAAMAPWHGPVCSACGLPLVVSAPPDAGPQLCPTCRKGEFSFNFARSYGLYGGALRAVILQLKFRPRERLGKRLGELLLPAWTALAEGHDSPIIVPVPLHPTRKRARGYNQADLLAEGLVREVRKKSGTKVLQVEEGCLKRTRATAPQTGLSFAARRENVRGVFSATRPGLIRGRVVVLVDDVMTTGATLSACAAALKEAGAELVLGLTLARATPQFPDTQSDASGSERVDGFGS